jgi:hypothetical protein
MTTERMTMAKEKKKVYILTECYKDGDNEISAVFDSMPAACRGFADVIAGSCLAEMYPGLNTEIPKNTEEAARASERAVARLLPTLIGADFGDDECRDGRTVYGLREEDVESIEDEEECNGDF